MATIPQTTRPASGIRLFLSSIVAPPRARVVNLGDRLLYNVARLVGLFVLFAAAMLFFELVRNSWLAINTFGLGFITGTTWDPVRQEFSSLPTIVATIAKAIMALLLAVPISVGTAIYVVLYLPERLRAPVSYLIEGIAAIPSVIIGLWGIFVLVPFVIRPTQVWLQENFGWFFLFDGPAHIGFGILAGGVILALMITPIITAITRDLIRAVPRQQMEGMLALGATKWEAIWKTVLPYTRVGIIGAVGLGLGRALGETMAVLMVGGNSFHMPDSLFSPVHSMPSKIAAEFAEATEQIYLSSLYYVALLLFLITIIINLLAHLLVRHISRGRRGAIQE